MRLSGDSGSEVRELRGRYPWLILAATAVFLVLVGRLWYLQMVAGEHYAEVAANNFIHRVRLPAPRGLIKDSQGRPVAENRPSYDVVVTPAFLPRDRKLLRSLASVLGLGSDELRSIRARAQRAIREAPSMAQLPTIQVKSQLTPAEERRIFERAMDLEGLNIESSPEGRTATLALRYYPSPLRVLRLVQEFLKIPGERFKRVRERALRARGLDRFEELKIRPDIGREELRSLTLNRELLPGVKVQAGLHRTYPYGERAAHAIGYTKEITERELKKLKPRGYRMGDYLGKIGIERLFERYLRGTDGEEQVVVDAKGRVKNDEQAREMLEDRERRAPAPGRNVILSLDMDLSEAAATALGSHPIAAVVAIDPRTGFIKALASKPSFDLNRLARRISRDELAELESNPLKPLVSKPLMETYFPGSTWKLFTAIAALEEEAVTPRDRFYCKGSLYFGRRFGCHRRWGHGSVDLVKGFASSCDVYFYHLGMRAGLDAIHEVALRYGFSAKTGLGFSESSGFIPDKDWYRARNNGYYPAGQDLNNAIGQGDIKVTLLQLALAYAAVANGGKLYRPQLVQRIETAEGKVVKEFPPVLRRDTHLRPEHHRVLIKALYSVTNTKMGTAYWRRLREYVVAGKTGTAQRGKNITKKEHLKTFEEKDDAVFVGFSPPDKPEILAGAIIARGGHGASVAMPIVNQVVKAYFDLKAARRAAKRRAGLDVPPTSPKLSSR